MRAAALLALVATALPGARTDGHVGPVTAIAVLPNGDAVACSQAGVLTGTGAVPLFDPPFRVLALAVEPEGTLLVAGGEPGASGHVVRMRPDGAVLVERRVAGDVVEAIAAPPGAGVPVAGLADGRVVALDKETLRVTRTLWRHRAPCRAVAFDRSGRALASGGADGDVWLRRGPDEAAIILRDHTGPVECLAFDAEGRLASGSLDGRVRIHDARGRLLHSTDRADFEVLAITAARDDFRFGTDRGAVFALAAGRPARSVRELGNAVHALACAGDRMLAGLDGALVAFPR